jgi:uncharacterized protein (TIGR03067 family)
MAAGIDCDAVFNPLQFERTATAARTIFPESAECSMKTLVFSITVAAVVAMAAICSAQDTPQESKQDQKLDASKLVGGWTFESGVRVGEEVDKARLGTVTISEKEMTIPVPGSDPFVMAYKIDNSHSPAHIDIDITGGPAPPSSAKGIIAMKDGRILLCYNPDGTGDRPASFESTADNGFNYFVISKSGGLSATDLVGTWTYASGMRGGQAVANERIAGEVVFTEDTITLPVAEGMKFVMSYKLVTDDTPIGIDLEIKDGPEGGTAKGIIKKDGDQIVFCYDAFGGKRPETFESTDDNGFFLFTLNPKDR